jgi:hypothetical protein
LFELDRTGAGLELALPHQRHRLPQRQPAGVGHGMLAHPGVHVVGVAAVVRAVGATKQVDEKGLHG